MHRHATLSTGPSTAQRLLRCGIGAAILMAACIGGARPRTTETSAESPVESAEVAVECLSRARVSDPRERDGLTSSTVHYCCSATNPYSPTHTLLASPSKGHCLPNGQSAPMRC